MPTCRKFFAFVAALMLCGMTSASAQAPFASYNLETGGFFFHNVDSLLGLRIDSATDILVADQATDLAGATSGALGVVNDQAPSFIEWGNLAGMTFTQEFAGALVAPFTPYDTILSDLTFLWRDSIGPTQEGSIELPIIHHAFAFSLPGDGSSIPLRHSLFDEQGAYSKAIEIRNAGGGILEIESVSILNDPNNLFNASANDLSIDLQFDFKALSQLPQTTAATADLRVETSGGDLFYRLLLVPEPAAMMLAIPALVGLCGTRCRSRRG